MAKPNTYHVFYMKPEAIRNINLRLRDLWEGEPLAVDSFQFVTKVEAFTLDELFREMNVVDGSEVPAKLKIRSMMVGDVVLDIASEKGWVCDMIGWKDLPTSTLAAFVFAVPTSKG